MYDYLWAGAYPPEIGGSNKTLSPSFNITLSAVTAGTGTSFTNNSKLD
jgi:hypothetical protein